MSRKISRNTVIATEIVERLSTDAMGVERNLMILDLWSIVQRWDKREAIKLVRGILNRADKEAALAARQPQASKGVPRCKKTLRK